jgi:hypothetical protein
MVVLFISVYAASIIAVLGNVLCPTEHISEKVDGERWLGRFIPPLPPTRLATISPMHLHSLSELADHAETGPEQRAHVDTRRGNLTQIVSLKADDVTQPVPQTAVTVRSWVRVINVH